MPSLNIESRRCLLIRMGTCEHCHQDLRRDYCRSCDEFWYACACPQYDGANPASKHFGHRRYLRFPVAEADKHQIGHILAEALNDNKDAVCPTCGKDFRHWHVENYDEIWRDGDVVCECGTRIRGYDAG